jgi:hypothetical protein
MVDAGPLTRITCGSGLARDGIGAVQHKDRIACIAGKPGSHRFFAAFKTAFA